MEGNQKEIKKHKNDLVTWNEKLQDELNKELKFESFALDLVKELNKQQEYDMLRKKEKELNLKLKKLQVDHSKATEEDKKQKDEDLQEIKEKKKTVNETEVEAKLHIQYHKLKIEGD